jgi:serine/threonine protein kinase
MTPSDRTGTILAGCRLDALLGRGAMGEVWRGVHLGLRRPVAVKVVSVGADQEAALLNEARALARVEHPNVVKVYDVRLEAEGVCLLLELVEGPTLLQRFKEDGPLLDADLLDVAAGVLRGVAAIHGAGLVHRDLKLDNVILADGGTPKITDFGLAFAREGKDGFAGAVVGTPAYISPEQWLGKTLDARADLYAVGVMLYALATGVFPFRGRTPAESREAHLKAEAVDPRRHAPALDAGTAALILRLLRKERGKRLPSAAEALEAVDACRRGDAEPEEEAEAGPLDLALRPGEFACPGCGAPVAKGARACPGCAKGFCRTCLTRLAGASGLCAACAEAAGPAKRR